MKNITNIFFIFKNKKHAYYLCPLKMLQTFIGRTDAEAPIFWPPNAKSQLIGKDPDAGKDRRPKEKGTTEHEMVGWHH